MATTPQPTNVMESTPSTETLAALLSRHLDLLEKPYRFPDTLLHQTNLLSQLTSLQLDLLRFHRNDVEAMHLHGQLETLAKQELDAHNLLSRLLALLHAVS